MDLFKASEDDAVARNAPLAVRMRPRTIDEMVGQEEFLGPGKLLRRMLAADRLSSLIFHGPPGTGKTTLAYVIARHCECVFHGLDAASTSVAQVRRIAEQARAALAGSGKRTVVFIDELHRFNRAQQDVLLRDVEEGVLILIGASTENPFFSLTGPLLSRSQIFRFEPLTTEHILTLLRRALADETRLKILYFVSTGERFGGDIVTHLGLSQPGVSRHLRLLTASGLLRVRQEGTSEVLLDL